MSKHKEISDKDILKIAMAIIDLLIATGEWFDTCVYFLNHAFCTNGYFHYRKPAYYIFRTSGEKVEKICVISNVRAEDYLKLHGGILSIAIDGFSNCIYGDTDIRYAINHILTPYRLYLETGEHWNFSVYPID